MHTRALTDDYTYTDPLPAVPVSDPAFLLDATTIRTLATIDAVYTDAMIERAAAVVTNQLRQYTDRKLTYFQRVQTFHQYEPWGLRLADAPVASIVSIKDPADNDISPAAYTLNQTAGFIYWHTAATWHRALVITYISGFDPLPQGLQDVYADMVEARVQAGGAGISAGAIESVTVPDVGQVRFTSCDALNTASPFALFADQLAPWVRKYA